MYIINIGSYKLDIFNRFIKSIIVCVFITTIIKATVPYKDHSINQSAAELEGPTPLKKVPVPFLALQGTPTLPDVFPFKVPLPYPPAVYEHRFSLPRGGNYPPLYANPSSLSCRGPIMGTRLIPYYGYYPIDLSPSEALYPAVFIQRNIPASQPRMMPTVSSFIENPVLDRARSFPTSQGFPLYSMSQPLDWVPNSQAAVFPSSRPVPIPAPVAVSKSAVSQNCLPSSILGHKRSRIQEEMFSFYDGDSETFRDQPNQPQHNKRFKGEQENKDNPSFKKDDRLKKQKQRQRIEAITVNELGYRNFKAGFHHSYTPDQEKAIAEIKADLATGEQMNRLVLGMVGSGKTEVACHAAWLIAQAGKQVIIIMPRRDVAQQYYRTFKARFEGTELTLLYSSSYNEKGYTLLDREAAKRALEAGRNNIVIGTKAALYKSKINNLGLVIIYEDHALSITQKEQLPHQYNNVHMLWMSATELPQALARTLTTKEGHIQDISRLMSRPLNRLNSINAFETLYEKVQHELSRKGNVFFVVPRIEQNRQRNSLQYYEDVLRRRFAPESILIAHGNQDNGEVLHRFRTEDRKILLSTAIIETVTDIPHVNTMIVAEPEYFSKAQLHQLRERIGHGTAQAYFYLFDPGRAHDKENDLNSNASLEVSSLGKGLPPTIQDACKRFIIALGSTKQPAHQKSILKDNNSRL
jgi:late competence protein required for DNA uptake (superfamily II DNA/RNA helicase)